MKPTFLEAPRTLMDAKRESRKPAEWANPIEHYTRPMDWQDKLVIAASVVAGAACLALVFA